MQHSSCTIGMHPGSTAEMSILPIRSTSTVAVKVGGVGEDVNLSLFFNSLGDLDRFADLVTEARATLAAMKQAEQARAELNEIATALEAA